MLRLTRSCESHESRRTNKGAATHLVIRRYAAQVGIYSGSKDGTRFVRRRRAATRRWIRRAARAMRQVIS